LTAGSRSRWRAPVIYALGVALLLVLVALVVGRPARLFGVEADPLASSLESEIDWVNRGNCRETRQADGAPWRCTLEEGDLSSTFREAFAVVDVDDWGCWDAEPLRSPGLEPTSGCIALTDYIRVFE
jgi:hypothetical protein